MANLVELLIQARDEASGVIGQINTQLGRMGQTASSSSVGLDLLAGNFTKVAGAMGISLVAVQLTEKAIGAVINQAKEMARVVIDAQDAQVRLQNSYRLAGNEAEAATPRVAKLIDEIRKGSRFDDKDIKGGLATLLQMTGDIATSERMLSTVADMAASKQKSFADAADDLARVLATGVDRGMVQYGFHLTETQRKLFEVMDASERASVMLVMLNDKVGGTAQKDLDSYSGKIAVLKREVEDLYKTIGEQFAPAAMNFVEKLTSHVRAFGEAIKNIQAFIDQHPWLKSMLEGAVSGIKYGLGAVVPGGGAITSALEIAAAHGADWTTNPAMARTGGGAAGGWFGGVSDDDRAKADKAWADADERLKKLKKGGKDVADEFKNAWRAAIDLMSAFKEYGTIKPLEPIAGAFATVGEQMAQFEMKFGRMIDDMQAKFPQIARALADFHQKMAAEVRAGAEYNLVMPILFPGGVEKWAKDAEWALSQAFTKSTDVLREGMNKSGRDLAKTLHDAMEEVVRKLTEADDLLRNSVASIATTLVGPNIGANLQQVGRSFISGAFKNLGETIGGAITDWFGKQVGTMSESELGIFPGGPREGMTLQAAQADEQAKRTNLAASIVQGAAGVYAIASTPGMSVGMGALQGAALGASVAGPYALIGAIIGAVVGAVAGALAPSGTGDYQYGIPGFNQGRAKLVGAKNIPSGMQEEILGQIQAIFEKFMSGYLRVIAKLPVDLDAVMRGIDTTGVRVPRTTSASWPIGIDSPGGAYIGSAASKHWFEHFQQWLSEGLPRAIDDLLWEPLKAGFLAAGLSLEKVEQIRSEMNVLKPEDALSLANDWADAANSIQLGWKNLLKMSGLGGETWFSAGGALPATYWQTYVNDIVNDRNFVGTLKLMDDAILKQATLANLELDGSDAQAQDIAQIGTLLKARYDAERAMIEEIKTDVENIHNSFQASIRSLTLQGMVDAKGKPLYQQQVSFLKGHLDDLYAQLAATSDPQKITTIAEEIRSTIEEIVRIGSDSGKAKEYIAWGINELASAETLITNKLNAIGNDLDQASLDLAEKLQPYLDALGISTLGLEDFAAAIRDATSALGVTSPGEGGGATTVVPRGTRYRGTSTFGGRTAGGGGSREGGGAGRSAPPASRATLDVNIRTAPGMHADTIVPRRTAGRSNP